MILKVKIYENLFPIFPGSNFISAKRRILLHIFKANKKFWILWVAKKSVKNVKITLIRATFLADRIQNFLAFLIYKKTFLYKSMLKKISV